MNLELSYRICVSVLKEVFNIANTITTFSNDYICIYIQILLSYKNNYLFLLRSHLNV